MTQHADQVTPKSASQTTFLQVGEKCCSRCNSIFSVLLFSKCAANPDGLYRWCKPCSSSYRQETKERAKQKQSEWRENNKDACLIKRRKYKADNAARLAAQAAEYYRQNKAQINAASKAWSEANKQRHQEAIKRWSIQNRDRHRATINQWRVDNRERNQINKAANERARLSAKLKSTPSWSDPREVKQFYETAAQLSKSTGTRYNVDHIVPLRSQFVCGLHVPANLQVIPANDNFKKGNRHWPDMPGDEPFTQHHSKDRAIGRTKGTE